MYWAEPNWYIDANEVAWLSGICDVWLCDVNDGCWDAAYNDYNDLIINFRDYAKYLDDNPWTSNLPDDKERQYYYLHDALGSVMGLVGSQYKRESDREFYLYDVYGTPSGYESAISGNPYGFTGKRFDNESGLYHYHYRSYDPDMGRWIQADPLGTIPNDNPKINRFVPQRQYKDGLNIYEFVTSNPANNLDSLGLKRRLPCIGGVNEWRIPIPTGRLTPPFYEWVLMGWYSSAQQSYCNCLDCCDLADRAFKKEVGGGAKWLFGRVIRIRNCQSYCFSNKRAWYIN